MEKKKINIYLSCKPEKAKVYSERLLDCFEDQIIIVQTLEEANLVFSMGEKTEELQLELLKATSLGLKIRFINYGYLSRSLKENLLTGEKMTSNLHKRTREFGRDRGER